jgi:hypothetical protein
MEEISAGEEDLTLPGQVLAFYRMLGKFKKMSR